MSGGKRICIVTAGHFSTCPRMMKVAETCAAEGYDVRVVCSAVDPLLAKVDEDFLSSRHWSFDIARFDRGTHPFSYFATGVRYRTARGWAALAGIAGRSTQLLGRAFTRPFTEILKRALAEPVDFIYAGTSGGVAIAAEAARISGRPYAIDLEDFYSEEQDPSDFATLSHGIVEELERRVLPSAAFLTCGSEAMAEAYAAKYGVRPVVIHNVFRLPDRTPDFSVPSGPVRLLWMSRTVGPGRGIEDAIRALGAAGRPAELTLRGDVSPGYIEDLRELASASASNVVLRHLPADMTRSITPGDLCGGHDVGLLLEQTAVTNKAVCLSNKPFAYMLAGLAIAMTDTPGQRALAMDLGRGAAMSRVGDVGQLAANLRVWADQPDELEAAKRASWLAAGRRWHWDHPNEKGRMLGLLREALGPRNE